MIKNHLKTALRTLFKNKAFTLINIIGLAIGISASIVIYLVAQYDFSFDKFHPNGERIYRVVSDFSFQGEVSYNSGVPVPLYKTINGVSGVQQAAPFHIYSQSSRVEIPKADSANAVFKEQEKIMTCDEAYFKLFPYHWLAGSPASSLQEPNKVVLTASRVKLYFPLLSPIQALNKTIIYDDSLKLTVSGIVSDIKQNTDFTFHDFISAATFLHGHGQQLGGDVDNGNAENPWESTSSFNQLFITLHNSADSKNVEQTLNTLLQKNVKQQEENSVHKFKLQPLNDLHFNSNYDNFDQRVASRQVLYSLLGVAAFLLMLGCINFINLTTAQSAQRAKEIGVRKTIGSTRRQLIIQFLTETFLLTVLACLLSGLLAVFLLKLFRDFIPQGVTANLLLSPLVALFIVGLMITVTLISGLYPALVMSGYQPVKVIKSSRGGADGKGGALLVRKSLTVFQFVIALFFIMTMLLVSKQIRYALNKDLGFRKDAVLYIRTPYNKAETPLKYLLVNKLSLFRKFHKSAWAAIRLHPATAIVPPLPTLTAKSR